MGLFTRKSNEYNADGTTAHSHVGRDAALGAGAGGAMGHHGGHGHTGRDALIGGAVAGEGEHLHNQHNHRTLANSTGETTGINGYKNGATGTTAAPGSHVRDGALGAGAGGLAGHEEGHGHAVRDGAVGAGVGAEAAQLHNKHEERKLAHEHNHLGNNTTTGSRAAGSNQLGTNHTGVGSTAAAGGGLGAGAGTLHHHQATTATPAPASALHANQANGSAKPSVIEADALAKKGRTQERLGHLFCSTGMEQKGLLKQEQAQHIRAQAVELNEAERLEHEAGMRRERAVGLGAGTEHGNGITGINSMSGGMHANRTVNPV